MRKFYEVAKGQTDIISAVIIIIIAIGLVGTAYTWGLPLIQKRQDEAVVNRVENSFSQDNANSITKKVESSARNGGEDTFSIDADGIWILNPCTNIGTCGSNNDESNSLSFTVFSRVSTKAANQGWITLSSTDSCPPQVGNIGQNTYVVCSRADSYANGYNVTYKVQFRELDSDPTNGFKIILLPQISNLLSSTSKSLRISRGNVYTTSVNGKTLIITEVKILLG